MSKKTVTSSTSTMPSKATPKPALGKGTTKEAFDREMARMKDENAKALKLNKELMDKIDELEKAANENKQTTEVYRQKIEAVERVRKGLENEIKTLEDRIAALDSRVAATRADKEAAEKSLQEFREDANRFAELEEKLGVANEEIQKYNVEVMDLNIKCSKQSKYLAEKQTELSNATNTIRELETKLSHARTGAAIIAVIMAGIVILSHIL